MKTPRAVQAIAAAGVVGMVGSGCVCSRSSPNGYCNVGTVGEGAGKVLASFMVGPRLGRQLNEGTRLTFGEGLRAVPWIGFLPRIPHAVVAATRGETDFDYSGKWSLYPAGRDGTVPAALLAAKEYRAAGEPELSQAWGSLLGTDYISFATLEQALLRDYLSRPDFDREVVRLAHHFVVTGERSPAGDPHNAGVVSRAVQIDGFVTDEVRRGLATIIVNSAVPDAEIVQAAHTASVIDGPEAETLAKAAFVRAQLSIAFWRSHSKQISTSAYTSMKNSLSGELSSLRARADQIKDRLRREYKI